MSTLTSQLPDEELAARAQSGEKAAFDVLVRRHRALVVRVARRLAPSASEAEDVAQETLLNAYRGLASFRRTGRFTTWLYRVAVNTALMRARTLRRHRAEPLDDREQTLESRALERADQVIARKQIAEGIGGALAKLGARQRSAFVWREVERRSLAEIAANLSVTRTAARQIVYRARLKLQRHLAGLWQYHEPCRTAMSSSA